MASSFFKTNKGKAPVNAEFGMRNAELIQQTPDIISDSILINGFKSLKLS